MSFTLKINMRIHHRWIMIICAILLSSCMTKGPNPEDPYERMNRRTYQFNQFFDKLLLKPAAQVYKAILPTPVRTAINNAYDNVNMIPTTANDVLQADFKHAIQDFWRFFINSTLGVGGLLDVAANRCGLPPRSNDLGLTFAKWGDKHSPYFVIPFLGPSTIRDGMAAMFEYAVLTPYPLIPTNATIYAVLGLRYVDLRSQLLETDRFMQEALDRYAFMRDAYLQHRNYKIQGVLSGNEGVATSNQEIGSDYITETAITEAVSKKQPDHVNSATPPETDR